MKSINLYSTVNGWQSFNYESITDLKTQLAERSISIGDGASIGNGTFIGDGASIGDRASIGNRASIGEGTFIGYGASIGDGAIIGECASIGENLKVKCIAINGSRHHVSYWGQDNIQIGCKQFTISEWEEKYDSIGDIQGYDSTEKEEYSGYISLIKAAHESGKFEPIKIA